MTSLSHQAGVELGFFVLVLAARACDCLAQRNRVYGRTGAYERLVVNGDERFGGRPKRQRKRQRLSAAAPRARVEVRVSCSYTCSCSSYVLKYGFIYSAWWPLEVPGVHVKYTASAIGTQSILNSVHWPCACYKIRNPTGVPRQALGTKKKVNETRELYFTSTAQWPSGPRDARRCRGCC